MPLSLSLNHCSLVTYRHSASSCHHCLIQGYALLGWTYHRQVHWPRFWGDHYWRSIPTRQEYRLRLQFLRQGMSLYLYLRVFKLTLGCLFIVCWWLALVATKAPLYVLPSSPIVLANPSCWENPVSSWSWGPIACLNIAWILAMFDVSLLKIWFP